MTKRGLGLFLLLGFFLIIPATAFAQESGLVPCGGEGDPCTFCDLFSLGNNIVSFLLFPSPVNGGFAIVPLVATVLLAYGGLQFLLGSSGSPFGQGGFSVQKGLQAITATVVGLVIVYTSWILIETFLVFAGVSSWTGLGNWWEIECNEAQIRYSTLYSAGGPVAPAPSSISVDDPFGSPVSGTITSVFGPRNIGKGYHDGIDIANDYNTPIYSPAPGTVTNAGFAGSESYGWMVEIDHGTYSTIYGHMNSLPPVAQNATVARGDNIGMVGSTGFSTGPHLHYEIRSSASNEIYDANEKVWGICDDRNCTKSDENHTWVSWKSTR